MNICPCLQTILDKFKTKKEKKPYEGARQFQQEQFMNPLHQQDFSLTDVITPIQRSQIIQPKYNSTIKYVEQPSIQQQIQNEILDVKMQFEKPIPTEGLVQKQPQRDIQDLIKDELEISPAEVTIKETLSQQKQTERYQENINFQTFSINLDPLDPYYRVIQEKAAKFQTYFASSGQKLQISAPNKTNLEVNLLQNSKSSNFIINYKLNCSFSYYSSVLKNDKLYSTFSNLIAQGKTLQSYKLNLTLNNLKFNRMGSFEPRQCYYVKYQNGAKRQHWQVYLNDQRKEENSKHIACEIFCVKNIRELSEKQLAITQYLEIDLQSSGISSILPKITTQLRNYLNNFQDYISKNYQQQMV